MLRFATLETQQKVKWKLNVSGMFLTPVVQVKNINALAVSLTQVLKVSLNTNLISDPKELNTYKNVFKWSYIEMQKTNDCYKRYHNYIEK